MEDQQISDQSILKILQNNHLSTASVGTEEFESFVPVPVANLIGENKQSFFIPSYQRGYRWDSEQIEDLLEDLYEFSSAKNTDEVYWLQPIVLKKKCWKDKNQKEIEGWEVVDGQQRLTSIYLLLHYLTDGDFDLYDITYETRQEINFSKLEEIDPDSNIDSDFISRNYKVIKEWIEKIKPKSYYIKSDIGKCLLSNDDQINKMAAFIVYILDSKDNTNIVNTNDLVKKFNNLNKNQIKLTGSELLKAQFVLAFKDSVSEFISNWNQIEYELQDDEFWNFLSNDTSPSTRIDLLFDIYTKKDSKELQKDYAYKKIKNELNNANKPDLYLKGLWDDIRRLYEILKLCYKNEKLRLYTGFLIAVKEKNWDVLYSDMKEKNKTDLVKTLNNYICDFLKGVKKDKNSIVKKSDKDKEIINEDVLSSLDYDNQTDCNNIRKLLLLHNIAFCIESSGVEFSFKDFKDIDNKCDIEHIDPHTPNELNSYEDACIYIQGMSNKALSFLWSNNKNQQAKKIQELYELKSKIDDIAAKSEELTKNQLIQEKKNFIIETQNFVQDYKIELDNYRKTKQKNIMYAINSIANLALLNNDINREYKNRPFPDKYETVLKAELAGKFMPPCTKFAFSKKYTEDFEAMSDPDWNEIDKGGYFKDIVTKLNNILEKQNEAE